MNMHSKIATSNMFRLVSKGTIPQHVHESILSTEQLAVDAFNELVGERLIDDGNQRDKMTKGKPTRGMQLHMK